MKSRLICIFLAAICILTQTTLATSTEEWLQFKYDSRHSGDAAARTVKTPLELVAAVPLTDAVFTSPVIADGRIYIVDGSGVVHCIDGHTFGVMWKFASAGKCNNNNISSPLLIGGYLHFGTTAGSYYVLNARTGSLVREIRCGDPIFSTPVAGENRVYFATLGSRIYAVEPDGKVCWKWDYAKEVLGFEGDR